MASSHGKDTYISIGANDISAYCNTSTLTRTGDSHDITGYGKTAHVKTGGLTDGSFSAGGWYDNTTAGTHDVLTPLVGTVVELIRRPEGTGTGKPQETVDILITSYVETNPVDDIVTWTLDAELSDAIVDANQ